MTEEYDKKSFLESEKKSFLESEIAENEKRIKLTGERILMSQEIIQELLPSMTLLRERKTLLRQQYERQIEEASRGEKL